MHGENKSLKDWNNVWDSVSLTADLTLWRCSSPHSLFWEKEKGNNSCDTQQEGRRNTVRTKEGSWQKGRGKKHTDQNQGSEWKIRWARFCTGAWDVTSNQRGKYGPWKSYHLQQKCYLYVKITFCDFWLKTYFKWVITSELFGSTVTSQCIVATFNC